MSPLVLGALALLALATSAISAFTGAAGGVVLLTGLLFVVPATAVVPLHAAVQLVATGSRVLTFRRFIRRDVLWPYVVGLVPGSAVGALLLVWVTSVSESALKMLIAAAILLTLAWPDNAGQPSEAPRASGRTLFIVSGAVCGAFGVLAGTTGPIVSQSLLSAGVVKEEHIATKAAIQGMHNVMKLPIFGFAISFEYQTYVLPLVLMAVATVVGTHVGKRFLTGLSSTRFVWMSRGLQLVLALLILAEQVVKAL